MLDWCFITWVETRLINSPYHTPSSPDLPVGCICQLMGLSRLRDLEPGPIKIYKKLWFDKTKAGELLRRCEMRWKWKALTGLFESISQWAFQFLAQELDVLWMKAKIMYCKADCLVSG
ncbi:MAG: hypothetical protein Q9210_002317 [Variospora velana]